MSTATRVSPRAQELRKAFDRSFAQAPRTELAQLESLLAIRLGEDPYAVRLAHLAGLFADKAVTRLPSADPGFLGIAAFRGTLVPVYDLCVLLGYPGCTAPRWLMIANTNRVALAFNALDGNLRLPSECIAAQENPAFARPHVHELVRMTAPHTPLRALIDLKSVVASIEQRVPRHLPNP